MKETTGIYRELLSAHALAGAARGGEMYARF